MPQFLPRAVYAHYLFLRLRLEQAGKTGNKEDTQSAVEDETVFGARLMKTNMIHARPLLGKEFYRHFLPYKDALEGTTEWPRNTAIRASESPRMVLRMCPTCIGFATFGELKSITIRNYKTLQNIQLKELQ